VTRSTKLFILSCILAFLLPIVACTGANITQWALMLLKAPDFKFLLLWLIAAAGLGAAVLKLARLDNTLDYLLHLVTSTALGLGIISLTTLWLGLLGLLSPITAWILLTVGLLACAFARDTLQPLLNKTEPGGPQPGFTVRREVTRLNRYLLLLPLASLALSAISALLPPGILWSDEPNAYDVLEYHLQVPREWFQLHRILPLHHNVFSFFPMNVEMHYLLAMTLRNGPWSGMYLAQLMHLAFIALTVVAIYALVAERSKTMAILAATVAATVPWMGLLAPIAYNEGGLLLWGTLAIGLLLRLLQPKIISPIKSPPRLRVRGTTAQPSPTTSDIPPPSPFRAFILPGALAGFASGSKLTAVPILLLALPLIYFAIASIQRRARFSQHVFQTAIYLLAACFTFSPWLLKNLAWTGNPVFPEATTLFPHPDWTPTQIDRWTRANHLPRPDQQNLPGEITAAWTQVLADWRFGFTLIPLSLLAAALTWKNPRTLALTFTLLSLSIFWLFFTHLQSRFFILAIPISALLIGQVPAKPLLSTAYTIIILLTALGGLFSVYTKLTSINPHLFDFIGLEDLTGLTPLADTKISPDANVYLIGDAKAFLYNIPTDHLFYKTVFDVNAQPNQSSDEAWQSNWPTPTPSTIQIIDAPELRRFARTYFGIPQPSPVVMQMQTPTVR
jgi:hypothetical protein